MKSYKIGLCALLSLLLAVAFAFPNVGFVASAEEPEVSGTPTIGQWDTFGERWVIEPLSARPITLTLGNSSFDNQYLDYRVKCYDENNTEYIVYKIAEGVVDPESQDDNYGSYVTLKSDNDSIATVQNGKVVAVGKGTTQIKGTLNEHDDVAAAVWTINVKGPTDPDEKFSIEPIREGTPLIYVGGEYDVEDLIMWTPEDATVKWSSDKTGVAEIKNGKITPKKRGKFNIVGKSGKETAKTPVHVNQFYCSGWSNKAKSMPKWKKTSKVTLDIEFDSEYEKEQVFNRFREAYVDGSDTPLTEGDEYEATEGSVVIELQPEYLETLKLGEHKLKVEFEVTDIDGEPLTLTVTQKFKIVDSSSSVDTADATLIGLGVFLFLLSLTYVALFTYDKKTRRFRRRRMAPARRRY